MSNPFKKLIQQYFYFSKSDRNAILILSILIVIVLIAIQVVNHIHPKSKYNYADFAKYYEQLEQNQHFEKQPGSQYLFGFNPNTVSPESLDSLSIPENIKRNLLRYRNAGGKFTSPSQLRKIYGMNDSIFNEIEHYIQISEESHKNAIIPAENKVQYSGFFDPNQADSTLLATFGFTQFQTKNLVSYREKGGRFKRKDELLKIYGIDSLFFASIENHIKIEIKENQESITPTKLDRIELNLADSATLVKIKGIGSVFATRIIRYRELLGGFYTKSQLLEVYNFPMEVYTEIENQLTTDTLLIKKVRINFAEFNELLKHPYLNKQQVQAILKYREKNGAFLNVSQINLIPAIDNKTFTRIQPYITCR